MGNQLAKGWVVLCVVCAACSSSSSGGGGSAGSGGGDGGQCPNIDGNWTIQSHCNPSYAGTPVTVTQNGCNFTESTSGFSGTLNPDGSFTVSGTANGQQVTCTGSASATQITENCNIMGQSCSIVVTR